MTDSAKLLAAEMAGALARARQSFDPVEFLEKFRDLLKKHESASRALPQSLLSSLEGDFFVPLAEQVPEGDEAETARFASVYQEVGDLARELAPGSPLAKRRETEQQVLKGVFREISLRNNAEKAEKVRIVEKQYEELLKARRDEVRSQPEVKSLVRRAIGYAILGVFAFGSYDPAVFKDANKLFFGSVPTLVCGVIGAIVGFVDGGPPGILGGGVVGLIAGALFIQLGLFIGLGAFVIGVVYFFRFRKRMGAVRLTAEESAARQDSIKNIEDYFQSKEELEQAQAVVAVAKEEAPAC
jgi:ABC-type multidrug transport system fused ATPase/permease subunit